MLEVRLINEQEIVQMVSQKVGISEEQSQKAVQVVIGYLKDKLPGPLAGGLNKFTGETGSKESESSGALNDLFGKKAS